MTKGVLIDLAGVVYSGEAAIPGALAAIARLENAGLPYRFITNTTSRPLSALVERLAGLGLTVAREHVFTPAQAAVAWLKEQGHAPHLLVHPDLAEDFADGPVEGPPAVVVGDAREHFTYAAMNRAFRALIAGAPFLALAENRVFLDVDGELSIDAGAYVEALAFATGARPILMGKPAAGFFAAAARDMGLAPAEVAMIGDDAEADVAGALAAGIGQAILVRTGKYRAGDEAKVSPPPSSVVDDLAAAVETLLAS